MAAEFIGSTVLVTLRVPSNGQIRGTVSNIVHQRLTLVNGEFQAEGEEPAVFNQVHWLILRV